MSEIAALLAEVEVFVRRFVVLTADQALAVSLWTVHSHAVDAIGITPYLSITSAEKGSGKTQLLEVLELLTARPWLTGSVTAATLARKIAAVKPTLLLDESDAAFNGDKEYAETLRGVLNSGFKASGTYSRCVGASGTNLKVKDFTTFCAKAVAGLGRLPDTVADRSIPIRLKRRTANEPIERKRERRIAAEAAPLRERIAAWAEEHADRLSELDLAPLDELPDRAADIWEPLLGIGYLAGETTFRRARNAAITLSGRGAADDESTGVRLLADIQAIFAAEETDRIASAALVAALVAIEESPWCEWHGKPITAHGVAKLLRRFEIRPRTIRIGDATPKGYSTDQFDDVFARYLNADTPAATATPPQHASLSEKAADPNRNTTPTVAVSEDAAKPHGYSDVADVAVTEQGEQMLILGDPFYLNTVVEAAFKAGRITDQERRQTREVHLAVVRSRPT